VWVDVRIPDWGRPGCRRGNIIPGPRRGRRVLLGEFPASTGKAALKTVGMGGRRVIMQSPAPDVGPGGRLNEPIRAVMSAAAHLSGVAQTRLVPPPRSVDYVVLPSLDVTRRDYSQDVYAQRL
jgi:hypothetical protein